VKVPTSEAAEDFAEAVVSSVHAGGPGGGRVGEPVQTGRRRNSRRTEPPGAGRGGGSGCQWGQSCSLHSERQHWIEWPAQAGLRIK